MAQNLKGGQKAHYCIIFLVVGFGLFDCPKQDNYFHVGSQQWVLQVN